MHWQNFSGPWVAPFGSWFFGGFGPFFFLLIVAAAVWSIVWKGLALWKAARDGSTAWFVALLIINTLGILEILYLYVFGKKEPPVGTPRN